MGAVTDEPVAQAQVLRSRAVALYTFLREFVELRSQIVRTVDSYEEVLWLADIPKEPGCRCLVWSRGQASPEPDIWIEIHKPRLLSPPRPERDLALWLAPEQIEDSDLDVPELLETISVTVVVDGEGHQETLRIEEHPVVRAKWESWVQEKWWPWREQHRRARAVQKAYTQLFSMYQKQQRLGEQYEVVAGLGLLKWSTPTGHLVERHLVAATANIRFDAARGIITVGPSVDGARPILEQDMLEPSQRPAPEVLNALQAQVAEIGDKIWDPAPMDAALGSWVHEISATGRYEAAIERPSATSADPIVALTPALILRRRTDRSFIRAFQEIVKQLQAPDALVPAGLARFLAILDEPVRHEGDAEPGSSPTGSETFFPLESNEAQRKIVERLFAHQGVLVQGPPGTGKSHTIVNLICHLLASGQRVLVTSHTARALSVLQRYIRDRVPDVSPLSVLLLGEGSEALQAMEDSVQGITHRQNHWERSTSERRIRELEAGLDTARRDQSEALSDLRAVREREVFQHVLPWGSYAGTLAQIAIRLNGERDRYCWIGDDVSEDTDAPLMGPEFAELVTLLRDPVVADAGRAGRAVPAIGAFLNPESFSAASAEERAAKAAWTARQDAQLMPAYALIGRAPTQIRAGMAEGIAGLLASTERVMGSPSLWARHAALQTLAGQDRPWRELLDTTRTSLSAVAPHVRWADEHPVTWTEEHDHREAKADGEALIRHLEAGGRWGIGPFRSTAVKQALYLRDAVRIGGRRCDTVEALRDLVRWLRVDERLSQLRRRWAAHHPVHTTSFCAQAAEFESLCKPLAAALDLQGRLEELRKLIATVPGFAEPLWHQLDSVRDILTCLRAHDGQMRLQAVEASLLNARKALAVAAQDALVHPAACNLLTAFDERSVDGYHRAHSDLEKAAATVAKVQRRDSLAETLAQRAPGLTARLRSEADNIGWSERAHGFVAAWNWARALAWVRRLSHPGAEQKLQTKLDIARDTVRKRLSELASEKAWAHCFARMREGERQHLVAWSKAVRAIGKGMGKYAPLHRLEAREHLNGCRPAIPAWVMPLYRVAETITPGAEIFDVVIIDEASQSGPEALLLPYLAKKMVVVGDDKQISPTHLGVNHEDVQLLRQRHLGDIPHNDSFGVQHSFFDLVEIRYPGRIRLREHFRCMPEIIRFSNDLCYKAEPLIPLRQFGSGRLSPIVAARRVPGGYRKGGGQYAINPPEAEAIVAEIARCLGDLAYKGKTFGVISLLAEGQAKLIERLLVEKVGPEEMERRQLVCGDAYAFQGDERDVMFLSLVVAPSEERHIGVLSTEADRRRFNVAASRARDQMVLYHSVGLSDLSPKCFRYALLEFCLNPEMPAREVAGVPVADIERAAANADRANTRPPLPFESWFEIDVFLQLARRGYHVVPQLEVAGRRIDLVVEGKARRLAVECDGDHWHGPEEHDADMARQRDLERCGWTFFRVRESAFRLDATVALDPLWAVLRSYDIVGANQPEPPVELPMLAEAEPPDAVGFPEEEEAESPAESASQASEDTPNPYADVPYLPWAPTALPDPIAAMPAVVLPGLIAIIAAEGPVTVGRACRLYVKAAGGQRLAKRSRAALYGALRKAIRQDVIIARNENEQRGLRAADPNPARPAHRTGAVARSPGVPRHPARRTCSRPGTDQGRTSRR